MKTLLSLFDYTGNWGMPFAKDPHWNVILVDIKHIDTPFSDIMDIDYEFLMEYVFEPFGTVDGILASVPCTEFAVSGARWFGEKDKDGRTQKAIDLVYKTLAIIECCNPDFWVIENPVSRIHNLVPELGNPRMYFNPCDFGDPYTKKTALYGNFNSNLNYNRVHPVEGSKMHRMYGGKSERTKEMRSETPLGFSNAFYEANKNYVYPEDEQLLLFH